VVIKGPAVLLPESLPGGPGDLILLQFGQGLARPPVVEYLPDGSGIASVLSFSGRPFRVVIPWTSILMMGDDTTAEVGFRAKGGPPPLPVPRKPQLRVVK
jgi:hypothetical protein